MIEPEDIHGRLPLAYRNQEFMDTPDARGLRILSEYLYPLSHFRKEKIRDTIVFFGSARTFESAANGRYYREARELARRITEWSNGLHEANRRFVVCSGGGPGIMEAANRGAQDAAHFVVEGVEHLRPRQRECLQSLRSLCDDLGLFGGRCRRDLGVMFVHWKTREMLTCG